MASSSKMDRTACTTASHPASWPGQSWRDPTADWISALVTMRIALPVMRWMVRLSYTGIVVFGMASVFTS